MKYFLRYIFEILITPNKAFIELIKDFNKKRLSFFMIFFLMVLYSSAFICLIFLKAVFPVKPFLNISQENFFLSSFLLGLPSLILIYFMCTAFVQFTVKQYEGIGNFEDTLLIVIFSLSIPLYIYWFYYFISIMIIITSGNTNCLSFYALRFFLLITAVLQLYILTNAVRILHIIKFWQALVISIAALIIFWAFFVIFFI
ncbi:MAG: hypothetical protein JXB50_15510 [Spirochaetes bacterium]|nr:hypothetical protein [Spirochaetota bacterium]